MSVIPSELDEPSVARTARAAVARLAGAAALACVLATAAGAQRKPATRDPAAVRSALQQLDASLAGVSTELARVDSSVAGTRSAVRPEGAAPLVVILRTDPGAAAPASATASVDDVAGAVRRYDAVEADALRAGGADELLRAALTPGTHTVRATVTVGGSAVAGATTVAAPAGGRVTFIEFTLRNGSLSAAAWGADAPAPARR